MVVEKGRKVSFDYTLTVDGKEIDNSEKSGPLEYVQGSGTIIEGLDIRDHSSLDCRYSKIMREKEKFILKDWFDGGIMNIGR